MSRHDAQRTGATGGKSNLTNPQPYWRAYLGGELAALALQVADVDGDTNSDVVFVSGGRASATTPNGKLLWQSEILGLSTLDGIADLDGDGNAEVVAHASGRVFVLAGATGAVEWATPDGEFGTVGVRMGDLDGDGRPELVLRACGCCAVPDKSPGGAYSFTTNIATPTVLWKFPPPSGCTDSYAAMVLADVDGSLPLEVASTEGGVMNVLDGKTGTSLGTSPSLGELPQYNACAPAGLDAKPGDEIVCVGTPPIPPSDNLRKAYALRFDGSTGKLDLLWTKSLAPYAGGDLKAVDPIADLDGNGTVELVVSTSSAPNVWTTRVLDALTGAELASLPDRIIAGRLPRASGQGSLLITTSSSSTLAAWTYDATAGPTLSLVWTIADAKSLTYPEVLRYQTSGSIMWQRLVTSDFDGDGAHELITLDAVGAAFGGRLSAWSAAGGTPKKLGSFDLPAGVDAAQTWVIPSVGAPHSQVAVERSDGHLAVLDGTMQPTNAVSANVPGIRTGGFFASGGWREHQRGPVVGALTTGGAHAIIAADSRRAIQRLDASQASFSTPPVLVWEKTHAYAPSIVPGLDNGKPGVACLAQQEPVSTIPQDLVVALRADGTAIWSKPLPRTPLNDVIAGKLDADAVPDLVVQTGDPSDTFLRTRALAGANGATLWNALPVDPGCGRSPAPFSLADWNSDGRDDVLFQALGTRVLGGVDGTVLASGGPGDCYLLPTVVDLNGNGTDEVVFHGGYFRHQAWSHDLSTKLWDTGKDDQPFPYAAMARCGAIPTVVGGTWTFPARLKVTPGFGGSAGAETTFVLAGGKVFGSESAAIAAGEQLGQLGSVSVHADPSGTGSPVAFVGSSDGWLYGFAPCAASLAFSRQFPAPVGNIVFGDTDGDGNDEILVAVADGYLYGLDQADVAAPGEVRDADPNDSTDGPDVDDVYTFDTLSADWDAVPNADAYSVAVVRADLTGFVAPWQNVGKATKTSLNGLVLVDGEQYLFAVRAIKGGAVSPDALSDGVIVHKTVKPEPDAGADASDAEPTDAGTDGDTQDADAADAADAADSGPAATQTKGNVAGGGCDCRLQRNESDPAALDFVFALGIAVGFARRRRRTLIAHPGPCASPPRCAA